MDREGRFSLEFDLDSARTLAFSDDNEATEVYMLPGEALALSLHTAYFDETLRFSGDGAGRNNALAALRIIDEMNWLGVREQEGADTVVLYRRIDAFTKKMAAALEDLAREYPEMAGPLDQWKTTNAASAEKGKRRHRQAVAFAKLLADMVGKPLVDIEGKGLDGEPMRLSQFGGKTTVVSFWATWCGYCKAEAPYWAELQAQYGERINFVSVCVWDEEERWKAKAPELKQAHPMLVSREEQGQLAPYMVKGIPRYMVIGKDLNIVTIDAPRPSSQQLVKFF